MAFRKIKPILTGNQSGVMSKPSLFRACANGDKAEWRCCEMKIMQLYKKANRNG